MIAHNKDENMIRWTHKNPPQRMVKEPKLTK